jgi:hypothetical protein
LLGIKYGKDPQLLDKSAARWCATRHPPHLPPPTPPHPLPLP